MTYADRRLSLSRGLLIIASIQRNTIYLNPNSDTKEKGDDQEQQASCVPVLCRFHFIEALCTEHFVPF